MSMFSSELIRFLGVGGGREISTAKVISTRMRRLIRSMNEWVVKELALARNRPSYLKTRALPTSQLGRQEHVFWVIFSLGNPPSRNVFVILL